MSAADDSTTTSARAARLALWLSLLPIVAINAAYLVAAGFEAVPRCWPYVDGCTSISSTGRTWPSLWIFKPLMLLTALLMARFFAIAATETRQGGHGRDPLALCGYVGAAALVLYIAFLGTEGPVYSLLRRYGVSLYFGFVFLGQLLLARRLVPAAPASRTARAMVALCLLLLTLGLASIPITNFVADKDRIENVVEWNFALLMQLNFLLAWQALREAGGRDGR